jgi:hypothetical protein
MPPPGAEISRPPVPARDWLLYRLRQQSLLGEFGRSALQTRDIRQILQRATELCAQCRPRLECDGAALRDRLETRGSGLPRPLKRTGHDVTSPSGVAPRSC